MRPSCSGGDYKRSGVSFSRKVNHTGTDVTLGRVVVDDLGQPPAKLKASKGGLKASSSKVNGPSVEDVNFKASSIFTSNDSLVNLAIVLSGALVMWWDSNLPDLILGVLVSAIAANGGREILAEAAEADEKAPPGTL